MTKIPGKVRDDASIIEIFIELLQSVAFFQLQCIYKYLMGFIRAVKLEKSETERVLFHSSDNLKSLIFDDAKSHNGAEVQLCLISVIIPTYNEEESIIKTINSILESSDYLMESDDLLEILSLMVEALIILSLLVKNIWSLCARKLVFSLQLEEQIDQNHKT